MLKNLKFKIVGGEPFANKNFKFNILQKNLMSYSIDKTAVAGHDTKFFSMQCSIGYINEINSAKLDYRIFNNETLQKLYPSCSKSQIRWLKNTGFDLINMESHHKCVQIDKVLDGEAFFKYVSFTTSANIIRLGFDKYKPIFLYNKNINGKILNIYIVPIIYESHMPIIEFNKYMTVINSKFVLDGAEKAKLNESLERVGKDFQFTTFNINKDFYELDYSTLDVNKTFSLTKLDFTAIEDWSPIKLLEA